MNKENKTYLQDVAKEIDTYISSAKRMSLSAIRNILEAETSEDNTFIELENPVRLTSKSEIKRVYRDGGLVIRFSNGLENNEDNTIESLNVNQLVDLLSSLNSQL